MQRYAIITAGGQGNRMGADVPKQFLELAGQPVIIHTVKKFLRFVDPGDMVVVLPTEHIPAWREMESTFLKQDDIKIVAGGAERFHSVQNGLKELHGKGVVAIHDAVRPLVGDEVIEHCYVLAEEKGAAIPVVPVKESIRRMEDTFSKAVDRSLYRIVQTPQCFNLALIKNAYKQGYKTTFTDDASVYEATGAEAYLTDGNPENIKITTPLDMQVAKSLLARSKA